MAMPCPKPRILCTSPVGAPRRAPTRVLLLETYSEGEVLKRHATFADGRVLATHADLAEGVPRFVDVLEVEARIRSAQAVPLERILEVVTELDRFSFNPPKPLRIPAAARKNERRPVNCFTDSFVISGFSIRKLVVGRP